MMVEPSVLLTVAVIALGMAVIPGPNVIYLVSRTVEEGRRSGLIALGGIGIGYLVHLAAAVAGLSAALTAEPRLYLVFQLVGAGYLVWLAWRALRTRGSVFAAGRDQRAAAAPPSSSRVRLLLMGTLTNVLNPKAPLMYASLIPQFIDMERGHLPVQATVLGGTHIAVSLAAHVCLVCGAGGFATFLERRPSWLRMQRYVTAVMLFAFAAVLAVSAVGGAVTRPAVPSRIEAAPPTTAPAATRPSKYYVVGEPVRGQREGLFSIAAKTLGDGRRHPELAAMNHDRLQADGSRMTDPLLIEPGWTLLLPPDAHGDGVRTGVPPTATPAPSPAGRRSPAVFAWIADPGPVPHGEVFVLAVALMAAGVVVLSGRPIRFRRPAGRAHHRRCIPATVGAARDGLPDARFRRDRR
jgi:threonine/homoserine/homoserine lactone efflux protein